MPGATCGGRDRKRSAIHARCRAIGQFTSSNPAVNSGVNAPPAGRPATWRISMSSVTVRNAGSIRPAMSGRASASVSSQRSTRRSTRRATSEAVMLFVSEPMWKESVSTRGASRSTRRLPVTAIATRPSRRTAAPMPGTPCAARDRSRRAWSAGSKRTEGARLPDEQATSAKRAANGIVAVRLTGSSAYSCA